MNDSKKRIDLGEFLYPQKTKKVPSFVKNKFFSCTFVPLHILLNEKEL